MLINNLEFAKSNQNINQDIDVGNLKRADGLLDSLKGNLSFKLYGVLYGDKPALGVLIYGKISTLCSFCLNPIEVIIDHKGIIPIFNNESELDEALFGDNQTTDDGILVDEQFNVLEFIEDEIIMLLPLAPKHETCNTAPCMDDKSSPFGILKQLIN